MKISPWVFTLMAAQISVILYMENSFLRKENRMHQNSQEILRDQINELNYETSRMISERDCIANRNYVLGAARAIVEPSKFDEIWHDGYNKGLKYASDHQE